MENNLPVNIREYQELAKKALPKMHYDYINGGAEDEYTLRENIAAYGRILLRPRVLVDVSKINMSTSLLGYDMPSPIIVAPTGAHKLANQEGEVATAKAAAACNTIMVLSFSSSCKIEEVASSCDAIRFYQLYVFKRRDVSATLVRRAESLGFKAIVLTVDTPVLGRREADIRNKMIAPRLANLEGLMSFDDDLDAEGGSKLERFASQTLDPSLSWKKAKSRNSKRAFSRPHVKRSSLFGPIPPAATPQAPAVGSRRRSVSAVSPIHSDSLFAARHLLARGPDPNRRISRQAPFHCLPPPPLFTPLSFKMASEDSKDMLKNVDWKTVGGAVSTESSQPVVKKRPPKKIRQVPECYFLPRRSLPSALAFYGAVCAAGVGAGMLLEVWINKKIKEDGGIIWEMDK